jgi:hypothetical protein
VKIYVSHEVSDRALAFGVIEVARDLGHEVLDPIEISVTNRLPAVASVDLFIAIVSARSNNVYFELGLVAALRKEVLVLATNADDVVAGAASFPYLVIGEDVFRQEDELKAAIERALVTRNARVHGARSTRDLDVVFSERLVREQVQRWFAEKGAHVEQEVGPTRADVVAHFPGGEVVVVEVRTLPPQGKVSVEPVLQLRSQMSAFGSSRGLLLTTGSATRAALELASKQGVAVSTVDDFLRSGSLDEVWERAAAPSRNPSEKDS